MNTKLLLLSILFGTLLSGESAASTDSSIFAKMDGGQARVVVNSVRDANHLNVAGIAVYGDVYITANTRIAAANLGCLYLSLAGQRSSKPYVESVAHILTNNFAADADGTVRAQLYWIFQGRKVEDIKVNNLSLIVDQARGRCLVPVGVKQD